MLAHSGIVISLVIIVNMSILCNSFKRLINNNNNIKSILISGLNYKQCKHKQHYAHNNEDDIYLKEILDHKNSDGISKPASPPISWYPGHIAKAKNSNVFLGCGVTILGNIQIGNNVIVGAGSIYLTIIVM